VRPAAIEDFADRLAFVRSERGDVDEGLHVLIPGGRDYGPCVSVGRKQLPERKLAPACAQGPPFHQQTRSGARAPLAPTPSTASGPMTLAQLDPFAQAPCTTTTTLTLSWDIGSLLVSRDRPAGHVVQVSTDYLWLRDDSQEVVADPLDQGSIQTAATTPRVSQVWQAMRQSCEGQTARLLSTWA